MTVTVLIADDHHITRKEIASLIQQQKNMALAGEAENGEQAVETALSLEPDLVIMDIHMPKLNGIQACRRILSQKPEIKILALSMYSERAYINAMLDAGASGYLLKSDLIRELTGAVETVLQGRQYWSPCLVKMLVDNYLKRPDFHKTSRAVSLTCLEKKAKPKSEP